MKYDTIIVDLDGTLANIDHRLHLLKAGKWREFYAACDKDVVNDWCSSLIHAFWMDEYKIIILTARSREVESKTRAWLKSFGLIQQSITLAMLRDEKDYTKDFELKRQFVRKYGKERILLAVEDRTQCVKMYREEGIPTLQCAEGDY